MRFVELQIASFGPLEDTTIPFANGLNVLYGPNESAKTTVHAALFAGLCGIRRGQGQPEREDRAFEARHRPWDRDAWEVAMVVELASGRRIRLAHDLANKVGSKAVDESTGKDISSEILFEGSIDGSAWVGLNRRSFRATACVRQAEIVAALGADDDHRRDHSALQQALQRAATTAGQRDETAAAALKRLDEFWRENVGLDDARSARRPYRKWKGEVESREQALQDARAAHEKYLQLLAERDSAIVDRETRQRAVRTAEAAVHRGRAAVSSARAARAGVLQAKYPAAPGGVAGDQALASEVTQALTLWESAPPAVDLDGKTSAALESDLDGLPERPSGDLTPAQEVLDVGSDLTAAKNLLRDQTTLREEVELSDVRQSVPRPPVVADPTRAWRRARIPMIAVGCLALAGIAAVAVGAVAIGAVLLVAAVAAAAASFWFLRPAADEALYIEPAPPMVVDRPSSWEARQRQVEERAAEAERTLREALGRRGVEIGPEESPAAALDRYKLECSSREEQDRQARQRDQLKLLIEQRKRAEEQGKQRDEAVGVLSRVAADLALSESDPEAIAAKLRAWHGDRDASSEAHDEAQREWAELEQLLGGRSLKELQDDADSASAEAAAAAEGFHASVVDAIDSNVAERELPRLRDEFREASELVARRAQMAESEAAKLKSVAEAEAELEAAETEFARVVAVDETLQTTIQFLKDAQQKVYESIAPILTETLRDWLPRVAVSANDDRIEARYNDAYVDPEGLAVRVRRDSGEWRDADLLSAGTKEQIYLLLRVALTEHLVKAGESVPLLLDEVTAQCDSARRRAVLELLLELSQQRQIVLFTHDDSVYEWAALTLPAEAVRTLGPVEYAWV